MASRAIFFDVDGVLNKGFDMKDDDSLLELARVKLLVETAKQVDAVLVISSTWGMAKEMLQQVEEAIGQFGGKLYGNVHLSADGTLLPYDFLPDKDIRILNWFALHREIQDYVALDDWDYSRTLGQHFIQTWRDKRYGLDPEFCAEIVKKFSEN